MNRRVALLALVALSLTAAPTAAQPQPLTLADATAQALAHLPDVALQREVITLATQTLVRAEAAYDPTLRLDTRARTRTDPLNTLFVGAPEGALAPRVNHASASVAWTRLLAGGGTITGAASTAVEASNSRFVLFTPAYLTSIGVEWRQPLLAGRTLDATRRALRVSALDVTRTRAGLQRVVSETVAAVERAYWQVRATREDVRIREQSLTLAEAQRDDTAIRIEAGIAADAELAAPLAEIARRRAELVRARDETTRAELALKQLMAGSPDSPTWSLTFDVVDDPPAPVAPDAVAVLIDEALTRRAELADVDAAREIAALDTALAHERTRTQMDLVASYNLRGLAGGDNDTLFVPFPGGAVSIPGAQRGGLDDSLQTLATHRFTDVFVGVSVAWPIGRRAARADLASAATVERRVALTRAQLAQRVAAEVRTAVARVHAAHERLDAAVDLERAATDLLAAEQARFDAGQSTTYFVLARQTELAQAALAHTTARIDAARANTELWRATGRLLERRGIVVDTPTPATMTPPGERPAPLRPNGQALRGSSR